jgi:hypothetical protein
MSNIYPLLPRLVVNSRFIDEFISAEAPCFALGLVEERKQTCGFLALRPRIVIPEEYTRTGFRFGHSLLGNADFVVVHFAFHFYNYDTFNVLVNPNNPVVQTVLNRMLETGDYFFFAVDPKGSVTTFRSELGQDDLAGLKTNLPLIKNAKTTDAQYRKAVALFEKNPDPPGRMLNWVCRDDTDYLDLSRHREELTPAPQPGHPKKATAPDEIIESRLIPFQLKTANEFNEELDELLARHCQSEDGYAEDSITGDQQIQWHPISMLPTFTFMVDGMLEESLVQLNNMRGVLDKPHVLDDATLNRVFDLYDKQLDDQRYFVEQFSRWKQGHLSNAEAKEVDRLIKQSATLKDVNEEILKIAHSIKYEKIDQILAMDDVELAIAVLSGKIKMP